MRRARPPGRKWQFGSQSAPSFLVLFPFIVNPMEAVEINTGANPRASVIWLHGLGADGHDFEPIVPELELDQPVRFVFPHAPVRPVTINQGMRMRAWYDILQFGPGPEDEAGVRASQKLVEEMIA